jgi:hypothetical protein
LLPLLVGGALAIVVAPLSWLARGDPGDTLRLLVATLALPVLLAIPVGLAFSRPALWSHDLSIPSFVAVRPLGADEMVAVKVAVAGLATAISWLLGLIFVGAWLSSWANVEHLSRLAIQIWAFHGQSQLAVYGLAALIVAAFMLLTWRFMVSGLWIGLAGSRVLFNASVVLLMVVAGVCVAFDASRLPGWTLEHPDRLVPFAWLAAVAVVAKYWLAAWSWRDVAAPLVRRYMLIWLAGTVCFVTLTVAVWGIVRIYLPLDIYRLHSLLVLVALLIVPLGRLGLAPSVLAANRHRR